jgi:PPM family protein phosphatase
VRGYAVIGAAGEDAVHARAPDGREVTLVFGDAAALAREAEALRAVARGLVVPEVLAVEYDDVYGSVLALIDPRRNAEPPTMHPVRVHGTLRAVLDVARALESAGYSWAPEPSDIDVEGEGLSLRRLRGAMKLKRKERLDARTVVERVGTALLERNAVIPFEFLRVLLPRRAELERHIEAVEEDLAQAAKQLSAPDGDLGLAGCTDVGLMREQNEDSFQLARNGAVAIAVVCDGVSASRDAHIAADIAGRTACEHLNEHCNDPPPEAMEQAIRNAHAGICDAYQRRGGEPLGTTLVAARVEGPRITVGWVGDSRAYFIGRDQAVLLTHDHSWLNEALAAGTAPDEAVRSPFAHALTRCLGPLEGGDAWHAEPEVVDVEVATPGFVILCSDGLWNYAASPEEIAEIVEPTYGRAGEMARALSAVALARGGQDNVTVAVIEVRVDAA